MKLNKKQLKFLLIVALFIFLISLAFLSLEQIVWYSDKIIINDKFTESRSLKIFLSFLSMIVGMLFKQIYDYVSINQDDDTSLVSLVRIIYRRPTIQALVVSPIVFYSIYNSLLLLEDNVVYTLFAFQNGFFWQSIFTRVESATHPGKSGT